VRPASRTAEIVAGPEGRLRGCRAQAWHHERVLSVKMNDKAVRLLGVLDRSADAELPGIVPDGLREWLMRGITRRGEVLTWGGPTWDATWDAEGAPASFPDLTGWECQASSFHIEDLTPAEVAVTEGQP
jgi:hypothetical protein